MTKPYLVEMTPDQKLLWDELIALVPYQKLIVEKDKGGNIDQYLIEKRQRVVITKASVVAVKLGAI
jgi:hypothetical protein